MPSTNPTFIPASEAARAKEMADIVRKVADTLSEKSQRHDYLMLVATFLDHFEAIPEPVPATPTTEEFAGPISVSLAETALALSKDFERFLGNGNTFIIFDETSRSIFKNAAQTLEALAAESTLLESVRQQSNLRYETSKKAAVKIKKSFSSTIRNANVCGDALREALEILEFSGLYCVPPDESAKPEPKPKPFPVKPSRDKSLEERADEFAKEHMKIADEKYPDMSWMQSFHVETAEILAELVSKANFSNAMHGHLKRRKERALRVADSLKLVSRSMQVCDGRSTVEDAATILREIYHEFDEWAPPATKQVPPSEPKAVHFDEINKASHYNQHPSGVECIQITRHMNNNLGNVVKYIWRSGLKDGVPLKDLKKAAYYLNDEITQRSKGKS